jgi:hypothetical protein
VRRLQHPGMAAFCATWVIPRRVCEQVKSILSARCSERLNSGPNPSPPLRELLLAPWSILPFADDHQIGPANAGFPPKAGKSRPKRGKGGIGQSWLLRHLADAPTGLVPLTGRRIAAGGGLDDRPPVRSSPHRVGRSQQGAFGIAGKELRQRQQIRPDRVLRIVRAQFQSSQKGSDCLGRPPADEARDPEGKMGNGRARAEFDRPLGGEDRLLKSVREVAGDGEGVMCVGVFRTQVDRPQRGLQSFRTWRRRSNVAGRRTGYASPMRFQAADRPW